MVTTITQSGFVTRKLGLERREDRHGPGDLNELFPRPVETEKTRHEVGPWWYTASGATDAKGRRSKPADSQ